MFFGTRKGETMQYWTILQSVKSLKRLPKDQLVVLEFEVILYRVWKVGPLLQAIRDEVPFLSGVKLVSVDFITWVNEFFDRVESWRFQCEQLLDQYVGENSLDESDLIWYVFGDDVGEDNWKHSCVSELRQKILTFYWHFLVCLSVPTLKIRPVFNGAYKQSEFSLKQFEEDRRESLRQIEEN